MGSNQHLYSLQNINQLLLFCIDSEKTYHLLDKSTHFIFKEGPLSPEAPAIKRLDEIISDINWAQDSTIVSKQLISKIATYNKSEVQDNVIDSKAIATFAVRAMGHGQILTICFDTLITVQILLNQIAKYSQNSNSHTTSDDDIATQFLQFIGQLCKEGLVDAAKAIHNFLHLGYVVAKEPKNNMNEKDVSLILGPALLVSLELDGCIIKVVQHDFYKGTKESAQEYLLFAKITHSLLSQKCFSLPFDTSSYHNIHQADKDRASENSNLCQQLWRQRTPTIPEKATKNRASSIDGLNAKLSDVTIDTVSRSEKRVSSKRLSQSGKREKKSPNEKPSVGFSTIPSSSSNPEILHTYQQTLTPRTPRELSSKRRNTFVPSTSLTKLPSQKKPT